MLFKINWASLIVESKFTIFALFYFVFEGNFPRTSSQGAYIWRGDLEEIEGGSQLFETAEKREVMKNGPLKGGGPSKYVSVIM